ncbi:MAG: hypothetical protein JNM57_17095 [Cyclobacteriaceae bacterium]|nr:hypothetical protein [Cyclobacteriaceae bacterium]
MLASVDAVGNINMISVSRKKTNSDSLLLEVNQAILANGDPVFVLNALSKKHWELVSVTQIQSDKYSRPYTPFMLYYIRKYVKNTE